MYNNSAWKIAGIDSPNLLTIDENKQILGGLFYETFKIIHEKLKFRYRVIDPLPKMFGVQDANGTWMGTVGQVANKEADLAFTPLLMTYERSKVLDYSSHVIFEVAEFIIKVGENEPNWDSVTKPFSPKLWLIMLVSTSLFGFVFYGILRLEHYLFRIKHLLSISKVFWFLFGSLVFQGPELRTTNKMSSRLSKGIWLLISVILVSSYSGKLMSFLTAPNLSSVPTTFDELVHAVENGKCSCGTIPGEAITSFIMGSVYGNAKHLKEHIISKNNFLSLKQGYERVMDGHFAYIQTDLFLGVMRQENDFSKILTSKDTLVTFTTAYGMRKGFPYKKELNNIIIRLFESGIINKIEGFAENVMLPVTSEVRSLLLDDFFSPFVLLFTGYALSIVCFIIELCFRKKFVVLKTTISNWLLP